MGVSGLTTSQPAQSVGGHLRIFFLSPGGGTPLQVGPLDHLIVANSSCPQQNSRNATLVVSPAPPRTPLPRPRLPPFPSQDALRGLGRKSAGSPVCVWVCLSRSRARPGASGIPRFPSEASPLSLPSPTEPLLEGSRPGPSPGREDVAPVHQGRWIQTT